MHLILTRAQPYSMKRNMHCLGIDIMLQFRDQETQATEDFILLNECRTGHSNFLMISFSSVYGLWHLVPQK